MAQPLINIGAAANDGTGDPLRTAFLKINRLPNPDNTVNPLSGDYTGSYEQKITAAVADGIATGKKYCWITQLYNPTLVTFNSTLRMLREGGDGSAYDVRAYGAAGDATTTTDATAITAADLGATNGDRVVFPRGRYLITAQISKSPFTDWRGVPGDNPPNATMQYGSVLVAGFNGTLVAYPAALEPWGLDYVTYPGLRGLSFTSPGVGTYAAAVAISAGGVTRQVVIEDGKIDGFNQGILGPWGELYLERLFISNCKYGIFSNGTADSWFVRIHAGSGLTAPAGCSGGAGFFLDNTTNCNMLHCRGQVQLNGPGFDLRASARLLMSNCIADNNETYGVVLINCNQLEITETDIFNNGKTGANGTGIRIEAISDTITANAATDEITITSGNANLLWGSTNVSGPSNVIVQFSSTGTLPAPLVAGTEYYLLNSGTNFKIATTRANMQAGVTVDLTTAGTGTISILGVTRNIRIIGGTNYDENNGVGGVQRQSVGIQFVKTQLNGAAAPLIRNITLLGHDLSRVATPILYSNHVDSELRILRCPGVREETLGASSNATYRVGEQGANVLFNSPFAADVTITLSQDGAFGGADFSLSRGTGATGAFNLVIKNSAGTTLTTIPADATNVNMARCIYFAGGTNEWLLVKTAGF